MISLNKLKEISIEITNACTQRCRHCSSDGGDPFKDELSLGEIQVLIDEAKELGAHILTLSGGDPCLRKDLFEIIKYARNKSFEIRLQTSGIYCFDNKNIVSIPIEFLKKFKKNIGPTDKIVYSLLGLKDSHEYTTTIDGSFNTVLESINKTRDNNIFTEVHTVVTKLNFKELPLILKVLEENRVNSWHLLRLVPQGRCLKNRDLLLNKKDFREVQETLLILKSEKIAIHLGHNIDKRYWLDDSMPIIACPIGQDKVLIRANGDMTLCAALKRKTAYNAKIFRLKWYWEKSWDAKNFRLFREGDCYNFLEGKCKTCSILKFCQGGCIAQRICEYNDIGQGPDPMCFK